MDFQQIKYEIEGRIAFITLNRPDNLNAWTDIMMHELIQSLDMADNDDNIRAVIVTGAGRAFCAGADLSSGGFIVDQKDSGNQNFGGIPQDKPR